MFSAVQFRTFIQFWQLKEISLASLGQDMAGGEVGRERVKISQVFCCGLPISNHGIKAAELVRGNMSIRSLLNLSAASKDPFWFFSPLFPHPPLLLFCADPFTCRAIQREWTRT